MSLNWKFAGAAFAAAFSFAGTAPAADWLPGTVAIPAGAFIAGSDRAERDFAFTIDASAYGHNATREQRWYETERARTRISATGRPERELLPLGGKARSAKGAPMSTAAFAITVTPITNHQYAAFVEATGHRVPEVDRATWESDGLVHAYETTRRFAWPDRHPPAGRDEHPVVLVSRADAEAYAAWSSRRTGARRRLPRELE